MSALLAALFDDHIRIQRDRTDEALSACKFDALAIFAGRAPVMFLDDQYYPFKANPHFKLWAPLADCADCWIIYKPATPLRLIFLQPIDYWYKPPALPADYWTKHFAIDVTGGLAGLVVDLRDVPLRLPDRADLRGELLDAWQSVLVAGRDG